MVDSHTEDSTGSYGMVNSHGEDSNDSYGMTDSYAEDSTGSYGEADSHVRIVPVVMAWMIVTVRMVPMVSDLDPNPPDSWICISYHFFHIRILPFFGAFVPSTVL
jgi:hypothetical protein